MLRFLILLSISMLVVELAHLYAYAEVVFFDVSSNFCYLISGYITILRPLISAAFFILLAYQVDWLLKIDK
jgi:hypothetical protein